MECLCGRITCQDAHDDPRLDRRESLGLGRVGSHRVEDVHEHEEERHEQRHPTLNKKKKQIKALKDD